MPVLGLPPALSRAVAGSFVLALAVVVALAASHERPRIAPEPDQPPDPIEGERVFRVALATRGYDALQLRQLEQTLWDEAGALLRRQEFDTLQVVAVTREELQVLVESRRVHLASVTAKMVEEVTDGLETILAWDYEPVAVYAPYTSVVVFRAGDPVRSFDELDGLRVAAVNRGSSSGYQVPYYYLRELGITPDFAYVDEGDGHRDVVRAVLAGDVRAGVTHDGYAGDFPDEADDLGHLVIDFPIPGSTWVLRGDIAARPATAGRLVSAASRWSVSTNPPGDYWAQMSPASPTLLEEYDRFRDFRRAIRETVESGPGAATPTNPSTPTGGEGSAVDATAVAALTSAAGRRVEVVGQVTSTKGFDATPDLPAKALLNFGGRFPDHTFTVVFAGDALANWRATRTDPLATEGRWLSAEGLVEVYRGKPQLVVGPDAQVTLVSQAEAQRRLATTTPARP